jgi:hypothetical protein
MMKAFLFAILFVTINAMATEGDMGLGAMLGNPTGLSAKYWLDDNKAIDGGAGFSFGNDSDFSLHSDFLLHSEGALVMNDKHPLDVYFGLGGRVKFADDIQVGARVPIGLAYKTENNGSDMFFEVAPVIDFISRVGVDLNVLIGARYYFR